MEHIIAEKRKRAVALGLFDGVHLGHREVIKYAAGLTECGFVPSVFTFRNSTLGKKQGRRIEYIYTDIQKELLLKELGIWEVLSEDFNTLKNLSGEAFVREILINRLNAGFVVCGQDFRFGQNAACGTRELADFGGKYGFKVKLADDIVVNGKNVSSNEIRNCLAEGEMKKANQLLGNFYRIDGEVVHGRQLGRTINFPTVNQLYEENQLVPRRGVYQSVTHIEGVDHNSITNIGVKPTVGDGIKPLAETHIIGYSGDVYGKNITVNLIDFVRDEKKFSSIEELRTQINIDIDFVNTNIAGDEL